ncbi:SusC/RagA family TonB-linked outer membrane protein [Spongiimicrobium sp. 3-5]|uniref:SusC/RagA family TonB-linked outer membrane protein n=1 Tax=Spongiimicrobium sp. 3-5 TaxID=3332596 RepID=UPI00397EF9DD
MKKSIVFKGSILLLAFIMSSSYAAANLFETNKDPSYTLLKTNKIKLTDALQAISENYHVFFSYETKLLEDIEVEVSLSELFSKEKEIGAVVNTVLRDTNLKFETIGEKYIVIYKNNRNGKNKLQKLKEKINELRDIENGDDILLYPNSKKAQKVLAKGRGVNVTQEVTITGVVTDEAGVPLIGATVIAKGTSVGTVTDFDGLYSLKVPSTTSHLVFSYIGYEQKEVALNQQTTINVQLKEDLNRLDEVVVTALGIERDRKSLSYAVSEVKGDQLANKAEVDVLKALSGKVAGVNISGSGGAAGSSTNIIIRGNNSATGNNQPLFVVDGIPFDNSTTSTSDLAGASSTYSNRALDLDPNDIATMTVLKGGAAAALYGSRASNGVIIITTHSGSQSKKGLEIEISNTAGAETISRFPDYQNKYGQGNFANGEYVFSPTATESWGPAFDSPNLVGNGGLFSEDGVIKYTNHIGDNVPYRAYPNNVKEFYKTGFQRETSIRAQGGDGKNAFAVTASNVDNKGFIPNTGLKRTSVKVSGSTKLENGLKISASVTYVNTHQDGILSGGHNTLSSINRQTLFIPRSYDLSGFPYIDEVTGGQFQFSFWDNPRWLAQEGPYDSDVDRVYGFVSTDYKVNEWLNISYKLGNNTYTDRRTQIIPRGSFFTSGNIINNNITFSELSSNLIATASKNLSEDLNVRVVLGHNYNQRKTDLLNIRGTGIIKRGISRITNTEAVVTDESIFEQRRIVGLFGDVVFSYKDFLFLNLTGRNDWSSTLPKGKRSFFYPSISTTFNFSDAFKIKSDFLSFGKVRLAYTKIGNDADPYLLSTVNTINGSVNESGLEFPFNGVSGTEIGDNLGNQDLKPEFTTEYEVGLELNLFNNLIGLDVAYYSKRTEDQIFSINIPSSTGYSTKTLNAGEISNKGLEVGLDLNPIRNPNGLSWNIFGTFAKNVSKVEKLIDGLDQINPGNRVPAYGNILRVGQPYGVIEGEVQNRDSDGSLLINALTGLPTKAAEQQIVGDPNPDFIVGINNTLSYKGFQLGFLFDWKQGGDILSLSNGYLRGFGLTKETAEDRDRTYILPGYLADPNDPTQPLLDGSGNRVLNNIQISPQNYWSGATNGTQRNQYRFSAESLIFDATVFRLRELSFGYTFPKAMLKNLPFGSLSMTFLGRNLWFKAPNYPHLDPEVSTYGAGNAQGVEQYAPPTVKNMALNIKVSF